MLPLKIMVNDEIVGWVMVSNGRLKFVSINPHVRAALFAAKDNQDMNFSDKEPTFLELTKEEERELKSLDDIEGIAFLARQCY